MAAQVAAPPNGGPSDPGPFYSSSSFSRRSASGRGAGASWLGWFRWGFGRAAGSRRAQALDEPLLPSSAPARADDGPETIVSLSLGAADDVVPTTTSTLLRGGSPRGPAGGGAGEGGEALVPLTPVTLTWQDVHFRVQRHDGVTLHILKGVAGAAGPLAGGGAPPRSAGGASPGGASRGPVAPSDGGWEDDVDGSNNGGAAQPFQFGGEPQPAEEAGESKRGAAAAAVGVEEREGCMCAVLGPSGAGAVRDGPGCVVDVRVQAGPLGRGCGARVCPGTQLWCRLLRWVLRPQARRRCWTCCRGGGTAAACLARCALCWGRVWRRHCGALWPEARAGGGAEVWR